MEENDRTIIDSIQDNNLNEVKIAIRNGVNFRILGDFPLRLSAHRGHLDILKCLVEAGADIHSNNDEALKDSISQNHTEIIDYINSLV